MKICKNHMKTKTSVSLKKTLMVRLRLLLCLCFGLVQRPPAGFQYHGLICSNNQKEEHFLVLQQNKIFGVVRDQCLLLHELCRERERVHE